MTNPDELPMRIAERLGRLYTWANQLELAPREHRVLCHLIAAGDKNLSSWWSFRKIGDATGQSEKSVQRAVAVLTGAGLLRRREQRSPTGRDPDHITILAPSEVAALRSSLAEQKAVADPKSLVGLEPDPGEYRLPMRPDKLTGPMDKRPVRLTDELSGLEEKDTQIPESSPDKLTGRSRRRSAGPRPAAAVFNEIQGAA